MLKEVVRYILVALSIVCFILLLNSFVRADTYIGLSGGVHNGHSYSSDDKIDPPGYVGHYGETKIEWGVNDEKRWDFTHQFGVSIVRFGKRNNKTMQAGWEVAVIPFGEERLYLRNIGFGNLFVGVEVGASIATDGLDAIGGPIYGFERRISPAWSVECTGRHLFTPARRHDLYGIGVKVRF